MTQLDVDDLIARNVRGIAADAHLPPDALQSVLARSKRRSHRQWLAVGTTAAVTALVVGAAVAIGQVGTEPPPASEASGGVDVADLTGKAVGDALGLEPLTSPREMRGKCPSGDVAEYDEGKGFCLQGMSGLEARLLGYQIAGHPRTHELEEYVRLSDGAGRPGAKVDEVPGLVERLIELSSTLEEQRKDAQQHR